MVMQMRKMNFALCLLLLLFDAYVIPAYANDNPIVVIVNVNNSTDAMSAREVRKLFLGKSRKLPDGSRAVLVSNQPIQTRFNRSALGKKDSQVKSAWSRLQFSGRAKPPVVISNPAEVVRFVSENENAVGYVRKSELGSGNIYI